jgi:S-methylmethionine-dependent homocysteine/selenocysteine methylase
MESRPAPALPHVTNRLYLTDGGIETTLIFQERLELPYFAAFDLLRDRQGTEILRNYYGRYAAIAAEYRTGFVLESATWRASADWGMLLGYSPAALAAVNRDAIELLHDIRGATAAGVDPQVVSGCVGPRGDGYDSGKRMTADQARAYHQAQLDTFADAGAELATAITMNYVEEAIGVASAAKSAGLPVVISFTVETDGRLPTGQSLKDAILSVDQATDGAPAYYMINCAHPTHFAPVLAAGEHWTGRIRGLRANASALSHAELNEATELDEGDPDEFGAEHRDLRQQFPQLNVLGGCCGTDHRHVAAIAARAAAIAADSPIITRREYRLE